MVAARTKVFPVSVVDQLLRYLEGAFFFVDMETQDDKMCEKYFLYELYCIVRGEESTLVRGLQLECELVDNLLHISDLVLRDVVSGGSNLTMRPRVSKGKSMRGANGSICFTEDSS